jgi:acyl-CoA synthetase (AMP-forming)/AMP-acid ligase II
MRTTPPERIEDFTHRGWWGEETLATVFDGAVEACPDRLALVDQFNRSEFAGTDAQRLTFAEAAQRVENMAAQLHANGIGQDDIVVVQLPNIVELALLYVAAAKLGVILSPAPVQYGLHELGKISEELNPRAFITLNEFKGGGLAAGRADAFQDGCSVFALGREAPVPGGAIPLDSESVTAEAREAFGRYRDSIAVSANDVFTICWTSGTTGQPKGVPRSHNMWLTSAYATFDCVRFRDGDVFLNPFPLVNMASIGGFLYNWLLSRSTLVLHHPLDRVIGSGGAPLSPWMVREYQQAHGIVVVNIFGSNEGMALISGSEDVPDPEDRAEFFPRYGVADFEWNNRVADRMKTRLQDVDTAEVITRPGRPGELLIWGASVFDGYYNAPETNRSVFTDDGFFHTGDLFEIAGDGEKSRFYRFVGRCKDIIVRGGVKISPDEIDNLLAGHPKLVEAAVVGYADEVMEERVCAAVVPKPGESVDLDDITGFLRSRNVAVFKLPERLLVLDQLPRNPERNGGGSITAVSYGRAARNRVRP